jgi:hypothetical protein
MDDERGPKLLSPRPCCVKHNFQFVTETPARGLQPGQRFYVRSHVMKYYRRNQRHLKEVETSGVPGTRSKKHATIVRPMLVDDEGSGEQIQLQADTLTLGMSGSGLPQRLKSWPSLENSDRSRPVDFRSKSLMRGSRENVSYSSSSKQDSIYKATQLRCLYCGAFQTASPRIDGERAMYQTAITGAVIWRKKSSPLEPIGAGRVDPFRSYPVDETSPCLHELMDHGKPRRYPVPSPALP